jgi:polyferredoxin
MLKKIRIAVSVIFFSLITLYFLDFAGFLPEKMSILADIQFVPALLALNGTILLILTLLTLLFGRIYCSSVCPLGVFQDIAARISKKFGKRKRYTYSKTKTALRLTVLGVAILAFFAGISILPGLLDPYGAYGRIVTHLFRPLYLAGNNVLTSVFTTFDIYRFYHVSIYSLGFLSIAIALLTFLLIGFLAWKHGRTYCNTICPVGTILGFLSKFSLFRVQFVDEKCNLCGLCTMKCKASCIDSKSKTVDYERCVVCFNCIEACNRDAMKYTIVGRKRISEEKPVQILENAERSNQNGESRRRFLLAVLMSGVAAGKLFAQKIAEPLLPKRELKRQIPVAPPGALNFERFREKCISCHLCVSKCPSHVIKPAFLEYGVSGMMQPKLYFDHGFCNYDCTVCCDVCPTDALTKLTMEEKHHTQMGQVNFILENCIVYYDETSCGACSEHCPTQAVRMVPYKDELTIPEIEPEICVGCGGCEYACPAIPYKAIFVEGLTAHNIIELEHEEAEDITIDDFGF